MVKFEDYRFIYEFSNHLFLRNALAAEHVESALVRLANVVYDKVDRVFLKDRHTGDVEGLNLLLKIKRGNIKFSAYHHTLAEEYQNV